ncbi:SCO family protein [Opitutaceae bacterium]
MNAYARRTRLKLVCLLFPVLLVACRKGQSTGATTAGSAPSAAATASTEIRHPLVGTVVKVDPERGTLLVDHEAIAGYMPGMVMEFKVGPGDLVNAKAGQRLRGELVQEADGEFLLEKIWPIDATAEAAIAAGTNALRQDTTIRGKRAYREVGENLPDFALYDQSGAVVSPARFRGKSIVLNFIYTRCPIATMCPAATERMMSLQRQAKAAGVTNLELISITLDPEFDTPGVLKEYAEDRGIDTSNFSFLTGPESAIKDLLRQFGVIAMAEGSILQHTLATLLINENGRIVHRVDGSSWDVQEFVDKLTH